MEHRPAALIVRAYFAAYEAHDRSALEELLAEEFRFTSPLDDGLDRDAYFERCWPFNAEVRAFDLERVFAQGPDAFVQYLCVRRSGETLTNVELFRTAEGKVVEVQVFFGSAAEVGRAAPAPRA
jgi:ketosteroid isomerase-like protein